MKKYIRSNNNDGPFSYHELKQFFSHFLAPFVPEGLHLSDRIDYVFPENFTGSTYDRGFNSYNTVTCGLTVDAKGRYARLKQLVEKLNRECFYLQVRVSPSGYISAYFFRMKFFKIERNYDDLIRYYIEDGNLRDYKEFKNDFGDNLNELPIDSNAVHDWFQQVEEFLNEQLKFISKSSEEKSNRFKRYSGDTYRWNRNNVVPEFVVAESEHKNVIAFIESHLLETVDLHISNIVQTDVYENDAWYDVTLTDSEGNSFTYSTEFSKYDDRWSNAAEGFDISDDQYRLLEEYCHAAGIDLSEFEDPEY